MKTLYNNFQYTYFYLRVTIYKRAPLYFLEKKIFESNKNYPTTTVPFFASDLATASASTLDSVTTAEAVHHHQPCHYHLSSTVSNILLQ